jgi:hypothetical protein
VDANRLTGLERGARGQTVLLIHTDIHTRDTSDYEVIEGYCGGTRQRTSFLYCRWYVLPQAHCW